MIQKAGEKKFLTENPNKLFRNGSFLKVPIMGGTTRDDGSAFISGNDFEFVGFMLRCILFSAMFSIKGQAPAEYFKRNVTIDSLEYLGIRDLSDSVIDFYQNKYFQKVNNFEEAVPALIDVSY